MLYKTKNRIVPPVAKLSNPFALGFNDILDFIVLTLLKRFTALRRVVLFWNYEYRKKNKPTTISVIAIKFIMPKRP